MLILALAQRKSNTNLNTLRGVNTLENLNNKVIISGQVTKEPEFDHEILGEKFYIFELASKRRSDAIDTIPILVSERAFNIADIELGERFEVKGSYRSFNQNGHLILSIFAENIFEYESEYDKNEINLVGFICKYPIYRTTPLGREIADLLMAVNRPHGKSDYIPCISWGRNASYASELSVGTKLSIKGRIQSRTYQKTNEEGIVEDRVAYEVSISALEMEE